MDAEVSGTTPEALLTKLTKKLSHLRLTVLPPNGHDSTIGEAWEHWLAPGAIQCLQILITFLFIYCVYAWVCLYQGTDVEVRRPTCRETRPPCGSQESNSNP